MSVLGKVLAVFNVLAAIAFLFLAATDWGTRHAWSYAVFRHDLVIKGLPVDENEKDLDGEPLVKRLGPETLQAIAGQDVNTQVAEVKVRQDKVRGEIEGAGTAAAQKQKLLEVLLPLQRTGGERDALIQQVRDDKVSVDDLKGPGGPFEQAFRAALEGKDSQGKELDLEQRRLAIAHLLFNLSEDPASQQRALAVCGLRAYNQAVDSQAAALRDMVTRANEAIATQRTAYEAANKQLVQRIEVMADRVADMQAALQHQKELVNKHQILVNARKADVMDITAQLEKAKEDTLAALKSQGQIEKELFEAQRALGTALDTNLQLEREIRTLETGR